MSFTPQQIRDGKHTPTLKCKHGEGSGCATCAFLDDPRIDAELASLRNSHDALVAENEELRRKVDEYREALAIAMTPPTDEEIAAALKAAKGEA